LLAPGLLLNGAFVTSDFLIKASDRSTFNPIPNLQKELKDFPDDFDFTSVLLLKWREGLHN
jgi:hypothetical protein